MNKSPFSEEHSPPPPLPGLADDVVELSFLFQGALLDELERAACRRGLSAGQLIRFLLAEYLKREMGKTTSCRTLQAGER